MPEEVGNIDGRSGQKAFQNEASLALVEKPGNPTVLCPNIAIVTSKTLFRRTQYTQVDVDDPFAQVGLWNCGVAGV